MTNQIENILAGPSREELFDALRLRHENRTVKITVECRTRTAGDPQKSVDMKYKRILVVSVDSIGVEDGSGNRWLLTLTDDDGISYDGYFDTERRQGWLKPKEEDNSWISAEFLDSKHDDPELERLDHELERAEHAMTHPNRHR